MTDPGRGEDNRGVDNFLVDGVAPSVIGGEPEPPTYHDPPTAPIPTGTAEEPRQSWFAKVFRKS